MSDPRPGSHSLHLLYHNLDPSHGRSLSCIRPMRLLYLIAYAGQLALSVGVVTTRQTVDDVQRLSTLLQSKLTTIGHSGHPRQFARIKKTRLCDDDAQGYTGYIDNGTRHIFFYFFESRNDPATDDVIFWTNGGPGCSSAIGLFMEMGPCKITDEDGPKRNPYSWNTKANILFVDQPVGVGFSYADNWERVTTSEEAARDVAAFIAIFFETFPQYKGRAFHMAGESYAGRYLPVFAAEVYDQNAKLIKEGLAPINLTSVMIGNGIGNIWTTFFAFYDMQCTRAGGYHPVFDISTCIRMKQILPRCKQWVQKSCIDTEDRIDCHAASSFCQSELMQPYYSLGLNPYDYGQECEGEIEETLCYPVAKHVLRYLDRPDVRALLGVDPSITSNYSACSTAVERDFDSALDIERLSTPYTAALLERGVKFLVYVGDRDWLCNWLGVERWMLDLEWSRKKEFGETKLDKWVINGKRKGLTRAVEGFRFVKVHGAGHMAPYDQPQATLDMVNRWISGAPF